jgi:ABC-type branched-subunit amino acid transport system permease subunit
LSNPPAPAISRTGAPGGDTGKAVAATWAGAFCIVAMQNYLAQFGQWVPVIQGMIFVLCVLLFRRGIIGELASYLRVKL